MKTVVEFPDQGVLADEAAEWLIRLDADAPPSRQELKALGEWLHRSPAHREELERLATLWDRMNILTELAVPLGKSSISVRPFRQLVSTITGRFLLRQVTMAAAFVGAAIVVIMFWFRPPEFYPMIAANGLYATAVGQQTTTELPDGSQIVLNTNSQIRVDYGDRYRQVHLLQGEALFTVQKDTIRPFRVYAGGGRIQAIGTAFSVYLKGADVEVTVTEGRVTLASLEMSPPRASHPAAIAGTQHDRVTLDKSSQGEWVQLLGTLSAGQVATISGPETSTADSAALPSIRPLSPPELAERLAWRDGVLMFSGDPLEDVVEEVSRYTTVSIEIPEPAIREMRIGGRFPVGETEVMLAALESNFNLRVTRVGPHRVILTATDH